MMRFGGPVRTTCPYCGVGCGVVVTSQPDGTVSVAGDPEHPANLGRLCSKGSALGETVDLQGRLLQPLHHGRPVSWEEALDLMARRFAGVIAEHGPDSVAFYVSGQLLTEDYYVANKLMKGFIGSGNIDTNSRLCMSSSVAGHKRAFGSDTVPGNYQDLELADLVVLTGSNTAWCHPVLYQRLYRAKQQRPELKVVVIDPRRTATCDIADLHLPLASGTDAILFSGLLHWLQQQGYADPRFVGEHTLGAEEALRVAGWYAPSPVAVAEHCGLEPIQVETFYGWFAGTEKAVTVYSQGINQSSSGTDKVNAIINCHLLTGRIGRPGMGPFSVTGQPNAMGGREVGALANQLAAHMDFDRPEHRDLVARFWNSDRVADRAGLKAVELFQAVERGQIKALWVMATNPAVSLPDADLVQRALARCEFLVVSDGMAVTDTSRHAELLLPALAWGEKDGTVTNSERRISRQRAFLPVPGEARADWWIICQVAQRMGFAGFGYGSAWEIFREHAALSGFENGGERDFDISALASLGEQEYGRLTPRQWPLPAGNPAGTERLFANGRFFTADNRARLVAVTPRPPLHLPRPDYPLVMNTGRVRDHWHTMTRTGKSPRLSGHVSEAYCALHPADAERCRVEEGDLVQVISSWGEVVVRARINETQLPGQVFVPMHWNDQFASQARVGSVVNPATDPLSGQPEFKHTPVRVVSYRAAWHGFLLSRQRIEVASASYWSRTRRQGLWHYELAGEDAPDDWAERARQLLRPGEHAEAQWSEMRDSAAGSYRAALYRDGRLEACIFIGPDARLPQRDWLIGLFGQARLDPRERARVLAGVPAPGREDAGPIVCACYGVGRNTLAKAIRERGLQSPEQIGAALQAGTNCGSCVPELRVLIAEFGQPQLVAGEAG